MLLQFFIRTEPVFFVIFLFGILPGCENSEESSQGGEHAEYADVPLHQQDSTTYYKYDIRLPDLIRTNAVLRDTLVSLTDSEQKQFLLTADQDSMPNSNTYPWELQLHVTVKDSTRNFISLLGEGYTYTGGAHGMPYYISLNYDRKRRSFVSLTDMLGNSTSLGSIVTYVRKKLREDLRASESSASDTWMTNGTEPAYSNYENFLLQPQGIRFIFRAYQVGPYVIGTPEVDVPVSVFREDLDTRYQEWFTGQQ